MWGELDGKPLRLDDLTSDSWAELEEKLKRVKWRGIPVIHAKRAGDKIIVTSLHTIPVRMR